MEDMKMILKKYKTKKEKNTTELAVQKKTLTPEQKKQFNANFEKRLTERPAPEGKMPADAE